MAHLIAIKAANRKALPFPEGRISMRQMPAILAMSGTIVLACSATAQATSTYDYKPREFALVDGGLAPNKRFSIAANGYRSFHVYLMAEPASAPIIVGAGFDRQRRDPRHRPERLSRRLVAELAPRRDAFPQRPPRADDVAL